jgi:leader peptidase (prepilin peptidase) / N-methyltransferase
VKIQIFASAILLIHLIAIAWVDIKSMIIPNLLNLSLGLCGCWVRVFMLHGALLSVLLQSVAVYILLRLISLLYLKLRGSQGLGGGDVKFLAAATCWIGIATLPWMVLFASLSGLAIAIFLHLFRKKIDVHQRLPFGPHLAVALFVTWTFRDTLSINGI